jgi:hypothetical protein
MMKDSLKKKTITMTQILSLTFMTDPHLNFFSPVRPDMALHCYPCPSLRCDPPIRSRSWVRHAFTTTTLSPPIFEYTTKLAIPTTKHA